jgi:hypothetical protein
MESALFVDNLSVQQTPTDMIHRRPGDANRHQINLPILKLYHVDMSLKICLLLATSRSLLSLIASPTAQ